MHVDPSGTAAMQAPRANKLDHFGMRDGISMMDSFIKSQQLLAPAEIADQKFPIYKIVPGDLFKAE